ncbi:subunit of TIM23 translocase complex [Spiromyces aspiralis]|uniref:Subunit of TIM23 translocase complex n=1 Tax=Spiromyces aspiralis TaxID=68401 RepID=A0ACC1HRG7_9FUNG|nr:subunit of TIM23 translocase complex [Spiromyces aspiralis]
MKYVCYAKALPSACLAAFDPEESKPRARFHTFGPGPRGYLGTIGQYALGSGAMFGFFMSIGSCIRNDDSGLSSQNREALDRKYNAAFALSSRRPRPIASYIDYRTSPPTQ